VGHRVEAQALKREGSQILEGRDYGLMRFLARPLLSLIEQGSVTIV
jgi:hypothetical protein